VEIVVSEKTIVTSSGWKI